VKSLVPIVVVLLVAVLTGGAARAHIDTLGTPDPYWQNLANGSSNGSGQIAADGSTAIAGVAHPWLLRAYLYAVGALFVAFAVSLLYSSWRSARRSGS
jgi:ABC-type phosphate transport system substrate-binding protein